MKSTCRILHWSDFFWPFSKSIIVLTQGSHMNIIGEYCIGYRSGFIWPFSKSIIRQIMWLFLALQWLACVRCLSHLSDGGEYCLLNQNSWKWSLWWKYHQFPFGWSSPIRWGRITHLMNGGRKASVQGVSFASLQVNWVHYTVTCNLYELPSPNVMDRRGSKQYVR